MRDDLPAARQGEPSRSDPRPTGTEYERLERIRSNIKQSAERWTEVARRSEVVASRLEAIEALIRALDPFLEGEAGDHALDRLYEQLDMSATGRTAADRAASAEDWKDIGDTLAQSIHTELDWASSGAF